MVTKTLDDLIAVINENPSEYEEKYVRFSNIHFDKKSLAELLYELKYLRENDEWPERQQFLQEILDRHDPEHLYNLLVNEPQTARFATIEKWARIAAMEILIFDKYSVDTLNIITQFPLSDYQLVVKRVHEIVVMIRDITTQATSLASGVAGL
jgi:hypothetical protein